MTDTRISDLEAATQANASDLLEASQVQSPGYYTRSITLDQVAIAVAGSDQLAEAIDAAVAAIPPADWDTLVDKPATFPPTVPIPYTSISGTPAALPPNGAAGGDLGGSYPNPTAIKASGAFAVTGPLAGTTATFTGTVTAPGAQLQMVSTQTGTSATGTTIIPFDGTIPQISEGNEYMTLSVTPKSATSKLVIEVIGHLANSAASASALTLALFQDAAANALAVSFASQTSNFTSNISLRHIMTAGTTSATTFRVRGGSHNAGTTTFNGGHGSTTSSIVITEVAA